MSDLRCPFCSVVEGLEILLEVHCLKEHPLRLLIARAEAKEACEALLRQAAQSPASQKSHPDQRQSSEPVCLPDLVQPKPKDQPKDQPNPKNQPKPKDQPKSKDQAKDQPKPKEQSKDQPKPPSKVKKPSASAERSEKGTKSHSSSRSRGDESKSREESSKRRRSASPPRRSSKDRQGSAKRPTEDSSSRRRHEEAQKRSREPSTRRSSSPVKRHRAEDKTEIKDLRDKLSSPPKPKQEVGGRRAQPRKEADGEVKDLQAKLSSPPKPKPKKKQSGPQLSFFPKRAATRCRHNDSPCRDFPKCRGRSCMRRHPACPRMDLACVGPGRNMCGFEHAQYEKACDRCEGRLTQASQAVGPVVCGHLRGIECRSVADGVICRYGAGCDYYHGLCDQDGDCKRPHCPFEHAGQSFFCGSCQRVANRWVDNVNKLP